MQAYLLGTSPGMTDANSVVPLGTNSGAAMLSLNGLAGTFGSLDSKLLFRSRLQEE